MCICVYVYMFVHDYTCWNTVYIHIYVYLWSNTNIYRKLQINTNLTWTRSIQGKRVKPIGWQLVFLPLPKSSPKKIVWWGSKDLSMESVGMGRDVPIPSRSKHTTNFGFCRIWDPKFRVGYRRSCPPSCKSVGIVPPKRDRNSQKSWKRWRDIWRNWFRMLKTRRKRVAQSCRPSSRVQSSILYHLLSRPILLYRRYRRCYANFLGSLTLVLQKISK